MNHTILYSLITISLSLFPHVEVIPIPFLFMLVLLFDEICNDNMNTVCVRLNDNDILITVLNTE